MDFNSKFIQTGPDFDSDSDLDEHAAHTAAGSGHIPLLIRAVQDDPAIIEQRDKDGMTPLTHAVNGKQLTAVKRLVKMGADVNVQDSQGRTYLSLAAYQGWYDGVVYLLRKGARPDIADRSGRTPLHASTYDKDTRCLIALLKRLSFEEINARDKEQMTALHWSAFHDRPDHVRELLLRDTQICVQDIDGKTPLHWAAQNGSRACCVLLADHDRGNSLMRSVDNSGKTPMHLAAAAGKPLLIKDLASREPEMCEAEDLEERTPLHWATAMGHGDCVKTLLKLGLSPNPLDQDGMSPLDYAKKSKHKQCALLLEEAMRIRDFQAKKPSPDFKSKDRKGPGYFRGLFGKKGKNDGKQIVKDEIPNTNKDHLPTLSVNGERKIVQGAHTKAYDDDISRLLKDQKVTDSPKRIISNGQESVNYSANGFVDESGYSRTPDRSHIGKKKKKKRHHRESRDDRTSGTSSPRTAVTSSTWDEDQSTGNNYATLKTTHLSPLRGSVSPRHAQSPLSNRDLVPTPRRLGELVPIRPTSLTNNSPLHHHVSILREDHEGDSRSPTPPPVFKSINQKRALPAISPLTKNFNTVSGVDSGLTPEPQYLDD